MKRFPNVRWFCDRCGSSLDEQRGFDDHKYVWQCSECGHKNSISRSNIYASDEDYQMSERR